MKQGTGHIYACCATRKPCTALTHPQGPQSNPHFTGSLSSLVGMRERDRLGAFPLEMQCTLNYWQSVQLYNGLEK